MVINIGSLFGRGTAFVVRTGPARGTILAVGRRLLALAALVIVMLVRATTKADRTRKDIWMATAGFTAIVIAAAVAGRLALQRHRGAERVDTGAASLSYIFAVATLASVVAFFVVLVFYREPEVAARTPAKPKRSVGRILLDMVLVLRSGRFALFLVVMSGFFFLYNQVYNVLPLYVKRWSRRARRWTSTRRPTRSSSSASSCSSPAPSGR